MIDGLTVLAVIPARGGSKGVPGKNVRLLGSKPLVAWTVLAARSSRYVDRVVLSSDDDAIMEAARTAGCEVPFRRDATLATDTATSVDVVLDVLERMPGYDIVVVLQPTSPLRTAEDIDAALDVMVVTSLPGCVSVCEASQHPWLMFERAEAGVLRSFCVPPDGASLRRQDLPAAYVLNGAVYAAETAWVVANRRLFQVGVTATYVMPIEKSHDIDTWDDIRRVDEMVRILGSDSKI